MSEADLLAHIQLALSRDDVHLFRTNAGMAWQGAIVEHTPQRLVLLNPHPVKLGPEGFSDLGGWYSCLITPDMVGTHVAIATYIEGKFGRRRATPAQLAFIETVKRAGGRAGVAYSVAEARSIIYAP